MPNETTMFPPQEAAPGFIISNEGITRSISFYFDEQDQPEDFYALRDNSAFDFWKSDEDNY